MVALFRKTLWKRKTSIASALGELVIEQWCVTKNIFSRNPYLCEGKTLPVYVRSSVGSEPTYEDLDVSSCELRPEWCLMTGKKCWE